MQSGIEKAVLDFTAEAADTARRSIADVVVRLRSFDQIRRSWRRAALHLAARELRKARETTRCEAFHQSALYLEALSDREATSSQMVRVIIMPRRSDPDTTEVGWPVDLGELEV